VAELTKLGTPKEYIRLFATGGRGFHIEVPLGCMIDDDKGLRTYRMLPLIYREMVYSMATPTSDLRIYSTRRGRMWRTENVARPNGKYKVQITHEEFERMDMELLNDLVSQPRNLGLIPQDYVEAQQADTVVDLAMLFNRFKAKVDKAFEGRKPKPINPKVLAAPLPSLEAMMRGEGIKEDTGFHALALQITTASHAKGWSEAEMLEKCQNLIASHQSDGSRYNTPSKRRAELRRLYTYTEDNPCYEFNPDIIRTMLIHPAKDLMGELYTDETVQQNIAIASDPNLAEGEDPFHDPLADIAGVTLRDDGVFAIADKGLKRVAATAFDNVRAVMNMDQTLAVLATDIKMKDHKKFLSGVTFDAETLNSSTKLNACLNRWGTIFQGADSHAKGVFVRLMEKAASRSRGDYLVAREGLDALHISGHEHELMRKPFLVWADGQGVVVKSDIKELGYSFTFQGFPEPKGVFMTDLHDAPALRDVVSNPDTRKLINMMFEGMLRMHRPEVVAKYVGWTVACFYRQLFHICYKQFPLLHVNGSAGAGKTTGTLAYLNLFYWMNEPKMVSPQSTIFSIEQAMAASSSIPLVIDEYKPQDMKPGYHNQIKLLLRDAYNNREITRGGGNKGNDDYRAISHSRLSAPALFIGEGVDDESALLERSLVISLKKPTSIEGTRRLASYIKFNTNKRYLGSVGAYIAAQIVRKYTLDSFKQEFDLILERARLAHLMQADMDMDDEDEVRRRTSNKDRVVFNHAVAEFGLLKFEQVVNAVMGNDFADDFNTMREELYTRMGDVSELTMPEWLKVFNSFADISHMITDKEAIHSIVRGRDYAVTEYQGREVMEIDIRSCYVKYRAFCRNTGGRPLYSGEQPFVHGIRDCPATVAMNQSLVLGNGGGNAVLDMHELLRSGMRPFK
jgi:hypothetical protein